MVSRSKKGLSARLILLAKQLFSKKSCGSSGSVKKRRSRNLRKKNQRNQRNKRRNLSRKRNSRRRQRQHRLRGGFFSYAAPPPSVEGFSNLAYSPLPCNEDGTTDWNSKKQIGHETCVEYGSEGASKDARASGLGVDTDVRDQDFKSLGQKAMSADNAKAAMEAAMDARANFQASMTTQR